VKDLNRRFTVLPMDPQDAHVKIQKRVDLRTIFCFEEDRTVSNDWVVQYANRTFQLLKDQKVDIRPKAKVTVAEWLDGSIHILHLKSELKYEELSPHVLRQERTERRIAEAISMIT